MATDRSFDTQLERLVGLELRRLHDGWDDGPFDPPKQRYRAQEYRRVKDRLLLQLAPAPKLCPECQQGKHFNCDGTAWDERTDARTECECRHGR